VTCEPTEAHLRILCAVDHAALLPVSAALVVGPGM